MASLSTTSLWLYSFPDAIPNGNSLWIPPHAAASQLRLIPHPALCSFPFHAKPMLTSSQEYSQWKIPCGSLSPGIPMGPYFCRGFPPFEGGFPMDPCPFPRHSRSSRSRKQANGNSLIRGIPACPAAHPIRQDGFRHHRQDEGNLRGAGSQAGEEETQRAGSSQREEERSRSGGPGAGQRSRASIGNGGWMEAASRAAQPLLSHRECRP